MKRLLYMTIAILACLSCESIDDMDNIEVLLEPKTIEAAPTLTVSPTTFDVEAEGGQLAVEIKSNYDWTISTDVTWCHLSAQSGNGDYLLVVTVNGNTSEENRTAKIIILYDSKSVTITVTQKGIENPQRNPDSGDNNPPSW